VPSQPVTTLVTSIETKSGFAGSVMDPTDVPAAGAFDITRVDSVHVGVAEAAAT
jgi:hypothetical protein